MFKRKTDDGKEKGAGSGPNMTPMVDVVMCILIFFMLGSVLVGPEMVLGSETPGVKDGGLSTVAANAPAPAVRFVLSLVRRGDVTWFGGSDGAFLAMDKSDGGTGSESVARYLEGKRGTMSDSVQVIISPEENVPYQDVVTVYDECGHAKFRQVAFGSARKRVP